MMSERERILVKIYKAVAFDSELREFLNQEWHYIYTQRRRNSRCCIGIY